jgi:hypothetical protein
MKYFSQRGWWSQRQYDDPQSDSDYRIPISKANLLPWHWNGLRGEMVTAAFVSCIILLVYVHTWKAAVVVPVLILCVAKALHAWHAFWIEILVRLLTQPEGYQDS